MRFGGVGGTYMEHSFWEHNLYPVKAEWENRSKLNYYHLKAYVAVVSGLEGGCCHVAC